MHILSGVKPGEIFMMCPTAAAGGGGRRGGGVWWKDPPPGGAMLPSTVPTQPAAERWREEEAGMMEEVENGGLVYTARSDPQ